MQAVSRHRSRSPAATGRYSKSKLPEVKTWVLVRAETNAKKRLWKNAVPGLVSKVTQSHSIDHSHPDMRVNVLLPNLFGLRYGFTGPRYAELRDLKLSDIRVYTEHDSTKLKDALVKAVQEVAKKRTSIGDGERLVKRELEEASAQSSLRPCAPGVRACEGIAREEESEQLQSPEEQHVAETDIVAYETSAQVSSPLASPLLRFVQSPFSVQRDTTQENIDALFTGTPLSQTNSSSAKHIESSQSAERHTTQENIAALFNGCSLVISGNTAAAENVEELKAAPTTPLASSRNLMRNDTPTDAEFQLLSQSNPRRRGDAGDSVDKFELLEFTAAVSKAFQDAKEDVLSKQSLEIAVGKSISAISPAKFQGALLQLDARNKIFLSDELVFLV